MINSVVFETGNRHIPIFNSYPQKHHRETDEAFTTANYTNYGLRKSFTEYTHG